MTTFTFTRQFHGFGSPKTTVEFEADQLEDVLENFTDFLRGCGYHIDGHLEVTETYAPRERCDSEPEQYQDDLDDLDSIFNKTKSVIK